MDPFISGLNFFDTTTTVAASTEESTRTKTTTSSASSTKNELGVTSAQDDTKAPSSPVKDGRGSPDPIQTYYKPPDRRQSKRVSRAVDDDVKDVQVGGERRLFVVNASSSESENE
jgi:hypothetical protein